MIAGGLMNGINLTDEEFNLIRDLVYKRFGISLGDHKRTLIIERLQKMLRTGGFTSFRDYYDYVTAEPTGDALLAFIDRVSTHHTFFFREPDHFTYLKSDVLPELVAGMKRKGKVDLRIWCAGCSSGEEPYTVAMAVNDYFEENGIGGDLGILATDISVSSLEKGRHGIYSTQQLSGVPPLTRQKYFRNAGEGMVEVSEKLKKLILFRRLNLMRDDYPFKGLFHIIFCRNVMIYFDGPTRKGLIERYHRYLEPGGYFFIGHSESIDRSTGLFKYIKPAVYQKGA